MMYPIIIPMSHSSGPWPLNAWGTIALFLMLAALLGVAIGLSMLFIDKALERDYPYFVTIPACFVFGAVALFAAVCLSCYVGDLVHSLTGGL